MKITHHFVTAYADIRAALQNHHVIITFGWQDVATRYRRSRIGAFWLTINQTVLIGTLGIIFGNLFNQPMRDFLPYLTIGLVIWNYISTMISEGCTTFVSSEGLILQVRMPLFIHVMRIIWRNTIILGHNIIIIPLLFLIFLKPVHPVVLLILPAFALIVLNVSWMILLLGTICARFRDFTQIVQNFIQVLFYLTPIIWSADLLAKRTGMNLIWDLNPFYHLITIIRAPLLGEAPTLMNWIFTISMLFGGWLIAMPFYGYFRKRIPYWL